MADDSTDAKKALGADREDFDWTDLALCRGMDTNMFYDDYESSPGIAHAVDQMCLSCPIMEICLKQGIENGEWGVWGGVYLVRGKVSKERNAHKSKKDWDAIKNRLERSNLDDAF